MIGHLVRQLLYISLGFGSNSIQFFTSFTLTNKSCLVVHEKCIEYLNTVPHPLIL